MVVKFNEAREVFVLAERLKDLRSLRRGLADGVGRFTYSNMSGLNGLAEFRNKDNLTDLEEVIKDTWLNWCDTKIKFLEGEIIKRGFDPKDEAI
jgi:hypothetical protein